MIAVGGAASGASVAIVIGADAASANVGGVTTVTVSGVAGGATSFWQAASATGVIIAAPSSTERTTSFSGERPS